ncbi:hypothetical protein AVEN_203536-1 [Araneus ventricosus]|uniref:Uncharacterized protein n=1 Tax=Araneus ventricosus TaxID=182803 RepID=A0A4Y2M0K1_ARAVE|nr:hypothetical protein AVEN_203536-1 [Araneus ventricosus]
MGELSMTGLLSVRYEISSRQVVWMVAVAIATGYCTGNPFRVGRSSFKIVTFAHLATNGKERATTVKLRRRMITVSFLDANWRQEKDKTQSSGGFLLFEMGLL